MALPARLVGGGAGTPGPGGVGFHGTDSPRRPGANEPLRHGPTAGGVLPPGSGTGGADSAAVGADAGAAAAGCVAGFEALAVAVPVAVVADVGGGAGKEKPTGCK